MNILESISGGIGRAVDYVVEKNRRAALINRIRIVIKNERENTARAYVALGKYYFEHLRDEANEQTERLCRSVEESERRMKRAFDKLDEITAPPESGDDLCADCNDDCDLCPYYDDLDQSLKREMETDDADDLPEKPFVNEAHDEAAAVEEQQTADSVTAARPPIAPSAAPMFNVYANDEEAAEEE